MAIKANPKSLNPLQLRTLAILQRLAALKGSTELDAGDLPQPHGDHFHLGPAVVLTRNASGLSNEAVWHALQRKGLAVDVRFPLGLVLTEEGAEYPLGPLDIFIEHSDH